MPTPLDPSHGGAGGATTGVNAPVKIYIFNGNSPEIFDPQNQTWSTGAPMPVSSSQNSVAVLNDIFYVIGGERDISSSPYYRSLVEDNSTYRYIPMGYMEKIVSSNTQNTPATIAIIVGGVVAGTIIVATILWVYHHKHALPSKTEKPT
jgi:hypothetical protein